MKKKDKKKRGKPPGMTVKGMRSAFITAQTQVIFEGLKKYGFKGRRDDTAAKMMVALYKTRGEKCPLNWETLSDNLRNGRYKFRDPARTIQKLLPYLKPFLKNGPL